MYPNNIEMTPAPSGQYVPYFYQAGLHLRYDTPESKPSSQQYRSAGSSYDFSSNRSIWNDRNNLQTVEDVITRGYFAVPRTDPIAAIITDKQHTARLGLDDVIAQVHSRIDLYLQNMQELDESLCEASNAVHRQVAAQGAPADNKQQYSVSKLTQELYEQKRGERLTLWRDVSRLRLGLPENVQQYLSAYRKVSAFESYRDESP